MNKELLERVKYIAGRYLADAAVMGDDEVTWTFVDDLRDMIWCDLKCVMDSTHRCESYRFWKELGEISSKLFPVIDLNSEIDFSKIEDAKLAKECVNPLIHFE